MGQRRLEAWAVQPGTAHDILKNTLAPNLVERIELEVELLIRGANAGISDLHQWFPLVVVVA